MDRTRKYCIPEQDLDLDTGKIFRKYSTQMQKAFGWRDDTLDSYRQYMKSMGSKLRKIPFRYCSEEDFDTAIQAMRPQRIGGTYSESTRKSIRSIVNDLCYFVEVYSHGEYCSPLWNLDWYESVSFTGSKKESKKQRQQREQQERINHAKLPRSLSIPEELKLLQSIRQNFMSNSLYLGVAVMFYMGLRPGECCGAKYGDLRPLYGHPEVHCLYIHSQIRSDEEKTDRLKTQNAYRILPVPTELYDMLERRKKLVSEKLGRDPSDCYVICESEAVEGLTKPCGRKQLSALCTKVLKDAAVKANVINGLKGQMYSAGNLAEANVTSYLLRRNFATALLGVCGLTEDELKYEMGHAIYTPQETRRDFLDPDILFRIWTKLNRRVLQGTYQESIPVGADILDVRQMRATLSIEENAISVKDNAGKPCAVLHVWTEYPNDFIHIKIEETEPRTQVRVSHEPVSVYRGNRVNIHDEVARVVHQTKGRIKLKTAESVEKINDSL